MTRRSRPWTDVLRGAAVLGLAAVPAMLALDRGTLLLPAAIAGLLDTALHAARGAPGASRWLRVRYGAVGPFVLAMLALSGAPGEAVVLASSWLVLCLLALGSLRAGAPLLAGLGLLALAPRPTPGEGGRRLRVATFNVEWGRPGPAALARVIRDLDADVVAVQELVDARHWLRVDLASELPRLTGMHACVSLRAHPTLGDFGTGILSRHPLAEAESLELPLAPRSGARRVATKARIALGGRTITVVSAHLDRPPHASLEENRRQAEAVRDWVQGDPTVVLCGDFNAFPVYPSHAVLARALTSCRSRQRWPSGSWPAPFGLARIDWIFVRGLRPLRQEVVRRSPTDHFPVVADLALPDTTPEGNPP